MTTGNQFKSAPDSHEARSFFDSRKGSEGDGGGLAYGTGSGLRGEILAPLRELRDSALGVLSGVELLDIGAAYGVELVELVKKGAIGIALDFAGNRLKRLPKLAAEAGVDATAVVGDCHFLPFPDESFDIVFGDAILAHLDRKRAFAEARRVLRPTGRLIFIEPLDKNPLLRFYRRRLEKRGQMVAYLSLGELDKAHLDGGYELHPVALTSTLLLPIAAMGADGRLWRGLARLLSHLDSFLFRKSLRARELAWVCLALYHKK